MGNTIPALRSLKQEDWGFEANLGYMLWRLVSRKNTLVASIKNRRKPWWATHKGDTEHSGDLRLSSVAADHTRMETWAPMKWMASKCLRYPQPRNKSLMECLEQLSHGARKLKEEDEMKAGETMSCSATLSVEWWYLMDGPLGSNYVMNRTSTLSKGDPTKQSSSLSATWGSSGL